MSITDYLNKIKKLQECIIDFIDNQENIEEHFQNLLIIFNEKRIQDDKFELKLLLHFITSIANNHYRETNFFEKIEKILINFQEEIKKYYSNKEIFNIFKSNKRILLFLFKTKLITFDQYIYNLITADEYIKKDYPQYFQQEINSILNDNKPLPENFEENRKSGQNDDYICNLIQKDSIEEFIIHFNKVNFSLKATINPSIYETNSFLLDNKKPTLIEYAVFYGSIQIFNFLRLNKVELEPSLWLYAIHGRNPELIHLLEESHIKPENEIEKHSKSSKQKVVSYREIYLESIRCHHNEMKSYIEENYLINENLTFDVLLQSIKYYNFSFIEGELIDQSSFHDFCEYDYYNIVNFILSSNDIDINSFKDNKTALLIAVENENLDLIRLLLSNKKIDINACCEHKIKYDDYNFNDEYPEEITPFYLAVDKENLDIIQLLLSDEKLDINSINKFVSYNKKIPESHENDDDEEEEEGDDDDYCNINTTDIENHYYEPLINHNEYKEPSITTVKSGEKTSFYHAVEKGNFEIIKLLLSNGKIDFNVVNKIKSETEEYYEKYRRYQSGNIYRWSVKTTKNEEKTAFYLAVEKGNLEIIQYLLSIEKVDVNIPNTSKTIINSDRDEYSFGNTDSELENTIETEIKTALYYAVENEELEILKLLLTNENIDVNIPCKYNEKYKLYTYAYSRLNRENQEEKTPLYLAVEYKNLDILNILLSNNKIDINQEYVKCEQIVKYEEGEEDKVVCSENNKIARTPLHLAVQKEFIEIIKILLKQENIDVSIKDDKGLTPIELAKNEQIKHLFNK